MPSVRREVHRGGPLGVLSLRVGPRLHQQLGDRLVAALRGEVQRREARGVLVVEVRAGGEQEPRALGVPAERRGVERGEPAAVAVGLLHAALQEVAEAAVVAAEGVLEEGALLDCLRGWLG